MEFYHVTVDFMTTSYVLNINLSDKFNTMFFFQDYQFLQSDTKEVLSVFISDMVTQPSFYL
jgi:hypothetical protein